MVEIGETKFSTGQVATLKLLGCLCLIDQGELDWKMLAINMAEYNENKEKFSSLLKIEEHFPGKLAAIREWFRTIKTYDGKKPNTFGYDDQWLGEERAVSVVMENFREYLKLNEGKTENEWGFALEPLKASR